MQTFPIVSGFPRPDWSSIYHQLDSVPESLIATELERIAEQWFAETLAALGLSYARYDSKNFCLLSGAEAKYSRLLLNSFESALAKIVRSLDGIASDEGFGKHFALVLADQDTYYNYISYFYPDEGEFSSSAGIYLNHGYGHFVFPFLEMSDAEATAAHELTHACLAHLPLPAWLNEGLAVTLENEICGTRALGMTPERLSEHQAYWNEETIQEFWSGRSYTLPNEGCELSYELGRYCVRSLAHDFDEFRDFVNKAHWEDSGEAAAIDVYGGSLGGLIEQFFGPGRWSPRPEEWRVDAQPNQPLQRTPPRCALQRR